MCARRHRSIFAHWTAHCCECRKVAGVAAEALACFAEKDPGGLSTVAGVLGSAERKKVDGAQLNI
jgi:hypothetical protein